MEEKKNPKYDGITITELEAKVEQFRTQSRENQKEMYECLEYLRLSNRFKENPRYKKATFWVYLEDRFTIRENTYRENMRAFSKFPEYSCEYGVGMVAKVDRECGGMRVEKVFSEIQREAAIHKTPLSRAKMGDIIQKNRLTRKIEKKITDWKSMYVHEKAAHDQTKAALRTAVRKVEELNEQIAKLRPAAQNIISIRELLNRQDKPVMRQATG